MSGLTASQHLQPAKSQVRVTWGGAEVFSSGGGDNLVSECSQLPSPSSSASVDGLIAVHNLPHANAHNASVKHLTLLAEDWICDSN